MSINNEQWKLVEGELRNTFGQVTFKLGDDDIRIAKAMASETKLVLVAYINEEYCHGWSDPDHELYKPVTEILWRKRTRRVWSPVQVKKIMKIYGKRRAKSEFPDIDDVITWRVPCFNTAKSVVTQYKRIKGLELICIGHQKVEDTDNG